MRSYADIQNMANADYSIGLEAHYKPFAQLINDRQYKNIVEVGTAYGGNVYHLLSTVKVDKLICVDPYIFYPAMPGFTCQKEYDTLHQFASNRLNPWPQAVIWKMSSRQAIDYVISADIVFLDGSHDYDDVAWECEHYSKVIREGGVLSGHDYNIFEGVNKAVDEFSARIGKPVQQLHGNIWYFDL
jgi:hypothetical protein